MEHSESIGKLAAAFARARVKFTPITKDRTASIDSKRTGKTFTYTYSELAGVFDAVVPALAAESLALWTPVRTTDTHAIATALLALGDTEEWIKEEYAVPIADPADPRSGASAGTYAQRYALKLLGIAPEEDDDAQAARGGDHETEKSGGAPCPACGVIGSLIKGKPEFGGGWICWAKQGGCGTKWPEGPMPTAPPEDLMPKSRPRSATVFAGWPSADPPTSAGEVETFPTIETIETVPARTVVTFSFGGKSYTTKGMTMRQYVESVDLVPKVDKIHGKDTARGIMRDTFRVATRLDMTEAQAEKFLEILRKKSKPEEETTP